MKASLPVAEVIMFIGVILIGVLMMFVTTNLAASSDSASLAIEQSSVAYQITAAANALSLLDEGMAEFELYGSYDLSISYDEPDYILTVSYTDSAGKTHEVENLFLTPVKETTLYSTKNICIIKEPDTEQIEVKKEC